MQPTRRLWWTLGILFLLSFAALGFIGTEIYRQMPPVPAEVIDEDGQVIYTREDIQTGRQVRQTLGGQQVGSVWGHGAYVAPDWSADWLHREAAALLDIWAEREHRRTFDELPAEWQAALRHRLEREMRTNGYDSDTERGFHAAGQRLCEQVAFVRLSRSPGRWSASR